MFIVCEKGVVLNFATVCKAFISTDSDTVEDGKTPTYWMVAVKTSNCHDVLRTYNSLGDAKNGFANLYNRLSLEPGVSVIKTERNVILNADSISKLYIRGNEQYVSKGRPLTYWLCADVLNGCEIIKTCESKEAAEQALKDMTTGINTCGNYSVKLRKTESCFIPKDPSNPYSLCEGCGSPLCDTCGCWEYLDYTYYG